MPIIQPSFYNQGYFHVYNRGVAKQIIYNSTHEYRRFLRVIAFYIELQPETKFSAASNEKIENIFDAVLNQPMIEIIAYCLMPNHFHLLVRQICDNGISIFTKRALNSYTRYYNIKNNRVGTVFQGTFRATEIKNNEQLLHVSRYIHLNPTIAKLTDNPARYHWSSYNQYLRGNTNRIGNPQLALGLCGSTQEYKKFVEDYIDYARSLDALKVLLIDYNR